ncbi:Aminoglycoside phosphotransferase [Penicillium riverlandense]|uniref:Aminoglycoside phosphotransferase n=1 Tax=Penicillium riverlandense TaxID=1903569 RepID=UPI002549320D|nr:Aminoglycoside phosphotransferase [Penicillium riverlandense]KAJ5808383.1 Aminoglycoside phosphotransferase [Penicillium riverlandense]
MDSRSSSTETQCLNHVLRPLFPPPIRVQRSQHLPGHLHTLRLLTLSNGDRLMLKGSPLPNTALLRREKFFLETEARFLALLGHSANPCIPQLYHYDPHGSQFASACLIRQYVRGTRLSEMHHQLSGHQRNGIDRHLGFLASVIGQNAAPTFGSLQEVAMGGGKPRWRTAFRSLFEGVLRDAEDMFISLPYAQIRDELSRLSPALEEVTLPRLVVVDFGRPSHVLLDEGSKQLSGIVDFGNALWGDMLMAEIFDRRSSAVWEGAGLSLSRTSQEQTRLLLYASLMLLLLLFCANVMVTPRYSCYRSVCQITIQYYRSRDEAMELEARRRLTASIAAMGLQYSP